SMDSSACPAPLVWLQRTAGNAWMLCKQLGHVIFVYVSPVDEERMPFCAFDGKSQALVEPYHPCIMSHNREFYTMECRSTTCGSNCMSLSLVSSAPDRTRVSHVSPTAGNSSSWSQ